MEVLIKKLFFAIVVGLYALVTGADRQFAGGDGGGFNQFFAPTITLNDIKIECACPNVTQSLCADLYSGAFDNFCLADLSDAIRLRTEAAAPASCTQPEIDQCVTPTSLPPSASEQTHLTVTGYRTRLGSSITGKIW